VSKLMAQEARAYFEAEAIRAEARDATRFTRRRKPRDEKAASSEKRPN
jgi:hypothetical protein